MNGLEIREAIAEDLPGILETLKLALGETGLLRRTNELWNWKHELNPFGRSIVLVSLGEDGVIAGVRAFMRWDLQTKTGDVVRCVRAVDTATHPDYVRRGIFRTLTMEAIDVARARGIHMIFNTPNEKSAPGYLSMGWGHVSWIGAQVRPGFGRAQRTASHGPPEISRLAPGAQPIAAMPIRLPRPDSGRMRTPRSAEYMSWRFKAHPFASYGWVPSKDAGGLVLRASTRNARTELVASEMLGQPHRSSITAASRVSRARYLAGWFSPGTSQRRAATLGGLLPVPGLKALRLVAYPLADLDKNPFDLSSWDLSTSDLELL